MKKACAVVLSILLMLCLTNVAFASGLETSCVDMALAEAASGLSEVQVTFSMSA